MMNGSMKRQARPGKTRPSPAKPSAPPAVTPSPAPLELGRAHAFLAAQNAFTTFLDIPCSLVTRTGSWIVVHKSSGPSVVEAQNALGQRDAREAYNSAHVARVFSSQQPVESELHGSVGADRER